MTLLSSAVTRRNGTAVSPGSCATLAGTKPLAGWIARSSNLSMGPSVVHLFVLSVAHRLREEQRAQAWSVLAVDRLEFGLVASGQPARRRLESRRRGDRHLVGRDVEFPVGAGDRHPLGMTLMGLQEIGPEALGLAEVQRPEGEQPPARHQHRVEPRRLRRRPQRREERPGETQAAQGDHWHASQSGLSMAHTLTPASAVSASIGTAFSAPALLVDFSAWVAPMPRR